METNVSGEVKATVVKTIRALLTRRNLEDLEFDESSDLYDDLDLDSLEIAELSATLEDDFGRDPYTEGQTPRTIGEVVAFYAP